MAIVLAAAGGGVALAVGAVGYFAFGTTKHASTYKLVLPSQFNGLIPHNGRDDPSTPSGTTAVPNGGTSVHATYYVAFGEPAPKLIVSGGFGGAFGSKDWLKTIWQGLGDSVTLSQKTDEDPGPLGGAMQCALMDEGKGVYTPICVWADNSASVTMLDVGRSSAGTVDLSPSAATARALRTQMEVKE
ncbi:hypothetical protein GCM10009839_45080 [Catenulispora yoronensis]|uniref:Uncharacterized protein n=1 Tax=Catenulispora yoronensis TaxID=450799 RepID=A0ABN2UJD7_9ACTN